MFLIQNGNFGTSGHNYTWIGQRISTNLTGLCRGRMTGGVN